MTEKPAPDVVEAFCEALKDFGEDYPKSSAERLFRLLNYRGYTIAALQARPDAALVEELESLLRKYRSGELYVEGVGWWLDENGNRILSALRTHNDTLEDAVIERCAQVAEDQKDQIMVVAGKVIAQAIRDLKGKAKP